jgi:hypothetical protein
MLAAGSGAVAAAHYVGLFAVGVAALEHSASTSGIAARASSTQGAASTLASATSSSVGSEELVRMQEAGPNIASKRLSGEWRLPLAILLHFLILIFNHNGLIDHVPKSDVIGVEQLKLNIIIQPIQEYVLLLFIHIDVVHGVPQQLNEWVKVLIHIHAALLQVSELLSHKLHSVTGHVVGTEMSLKLIPRNRIDVYVGVAAHLPPICCCSKELVHGKKDLIVIRALGYHELLLISLELILGLHGILSLRENGGVSL